MKYALIIAGVLIVLIGGFYAFNSYIYNEKQADPNEIERPSNPDDTLPPLPDAPTETPMTYTPPSSDGLTFTETDTGLQYAVITEGNVETKPQVTDTVSVHYHGTLEDGSVFDSSYQRGEPIQFPLQGLIPGWQEGIPLMSVGSTYRFIIPAELAYGPAGSGHPLAGQTLIFDVELLEIL